MALLASGQIGLLIVGSFVLSVFSTVAGAHFKVLMSVLCVIPLLTCMVRYVVHTYHSHYACACMAL